MAREAQEQGADYLMAHNVTSIKVEPDRVVITAEHSGDVLMFEARAVVLATGFSSKLPETAGFGKSKRWAAGAQVEVEAGTIDEVEIFLGKNVAPGFFGWAIPTGATRALVGLLVEREANIRLEKLIAVLEESGKISAPEGRFQYRGVTLASPKKTCVNRLLLVGDAAGQVKPLTGGGIYFGLLCADIAASTLHKAMDVTDFSAANLHSYEKEWKHLLGQELRLGGWASRIYGRLGDRTIDRVVETARKRGIAESLSEAGGIGFDWHGSAILQITRELLWRHNKPPDKAPSDD
jgi:flavin-dependent dehydrogenase